MIKVEFLFVLGCQIPEDKPKSGHWLKIRPRKIPKILSFSKDPQFPQRNSSKSCEERGSGNIMGQKMKILQKQTQCR